MKRPEKLVPSSNETSIPVQIATNYNNTSNSMVTSIISMASSTSQQPNTNRHSENLFIWSHISCGLLSTWLNGGGDFNDKRKLLVIDSRESNEFNKLHIKTAINIPDSNIVRQQLKSDKISINELLLKYSENTLDLGTIEAIVVYDHQSEHTNQLDADHSFACILLRRLASKYHSVSFLTGGLVQFNQLHPNLCQQSALNSLSSTHIVPVVVVNTNSNSTIEEETTNNKPVQDNSSNQQSAPNWLSTIRPKQMRFGYSLSTFGLNLSALSTSSSSNTLSSASCSLLTAEPATVLSSSSSAASSLGSFNFGASVVAGSDDEAKSAQANKGPTEILSFLYLGSQEDALCEQTLKRLNITNILNVSATCPKPAFIDDAHFLRISINDGHGEKISPYFDVAYRFIEKCRRANTKVLIHCLAGISRSPTLAIAYLMKHLGLKSDDAYRFVKERRKTISPNFNFLGQLYEYEKTFLLNNNNNTNNNNDNNSSSSSFSNQGSGTTNETSNETTTNQDSSQSSQNPPIVKNVGKKMPLLVSPTTTTETSSTAPPSKAALHRRQYIFRFNTASPFDLSGSSSSNESQTLLCSAHSSHQSLLSPSQALSSFNLNSPTADSHPTSHASSSNHPFSFGPKATAMSRSNFLGGAVMNKSKTMDMIATTTTTPSPVVTPSGVVLRRPTNLQMVEEKKQSSGASGVVQRPSTMGSNLLKRPSSILLGSSSSSSLSTAGTTNSSQVPTAMMSSSPKQHLMCREVQYNRTYSNTSAGSSTSTSCSSCSNMSSPSVGCNGCSSCSMTTSSTQSTLVGGSSCSGSGSSSSSTTSQKKLKLSPVQDRLVLGAFAIAAAAAAAANSDNETMQSAMDTTTVDDYPTSPPPSKKAQQSSGGAAANNNNSTGGTTPTTPLTPNSSLNIVNSFANQSGQQQRGNSTLMTSSLSSLSSSPWKTSAASKENQEELASSVAAVTAAAVAAAAAANLTTSLSLNSINQASSSSAPSNTVKSSSSSSSSKNSLCETMIEVS